MTECRECGSDRTSVIPHADENVKCIECGARYQDDGAKPTAARESHRDGQQSQQRRQVTLGRFQS